MRASLFPARVGAGLLLFSLVVSGCRCGENTQRKDPEIQVADTLIDFGTVQTDVEHVRELRVYNAGAGTLNISEFRVAAPFGVKDVAPLSVGTGQEVLLQLTFKPTVADERLSAKLVIVSDDPETAEAEVDLVGAGITAAAKADPNPIAFGDVYVNETKTVKVKIHNGGSNALTITGREFLPNTPVEISSLTDLNTIPATIPAGGDAFFDAKFKPSVMSETTPGGVKLILDPLQGTELVIPFAGRGVRAIPRLCFQYEGSAIETCTSPDATTGPGSAITIAVPPLCDNLLYPPDGGATATTCGGAPYDMKGRFYVRNEGNVPVKYSMEFVPDMEKGCDGGTPERIDFQFSNSPDAGLTKFNEATVQLPLSPADPKPWETVGFDINYHATAACPDEAADSARIQWTRQGDNRQPINLAAYFSGQSRLPNAVSADTSISGKTGSIAPLYGAGNQGIAEFQVTSVKFYEVITPVPGGACVSADAGPFQECDLGVSVSDCFQWSFADGGDPNLTGPHTVPIGPDGGLGLVTIGGLVFSANGSAVEGQPYCVYQVATTTDPFNPVVVSKIQGTRTQ